MGIIVQCSNTTKPCSNVIHFESIFDLEMNLYSEYYHRMEYQYTPKHIQETVKIYGKHRRIFCVECSQHTLGTCGLCHSRRDVPSKSLGFSVQCHDHHLIECVVCKQEFDEYSP